MPDINVNAKILYEMARKKMNELEARMCELEEELRAVQEEHGALYGMAMAYEGPKPGEVIEMDGPPEVTKASANIKLRREF